MCEKGVTKGGNGEMVDFILLPYAALAIAILLLLLLMAFSRRSYWFLPKPYRGNDGYLNHASNRASDTSASRKVRTSRQLRRAMKGTADSSGIKESRTQQAIAGKTDTRISKIEDTRSWDTKDGSGRCHRPLPIFMESPYLTVFSPPGDALLRFLSPVLLHKEVPNHPRARQRHLLPTDHR
jgi:hypothetical protein